MLGLDSLLNYRNRKQLPIAKEIITFLHHCPNDVVLVWVLEEGGIVGQESDYEVAKNASGHFPSTRMPIAIEDFKRYTQHKFLIK